MLKNIGHSSRVDAPLTAIYFKVFNAIAQEVEIFLIEYQVTLA